MPRRNETTPKKRPVEQYDHKGKKRLNNPPVGLVDASTDAIEGRKTYAYDPHLDPQLVWAGKAERTSFETPTVSLHVHERIDPRGIVEAVRKKNGSGYEQLSLFAAREENPPLREAIDFYKHAHNWSNRLIAGDSLLVMNSLIEKEGLAGQVQMIYIDPPYGIKYGSNFQPFVNKRDVKDGKDEDLNQEPEMIKAFRDTWELGIHSYLTYLRDRLLLARELLNESGSCFVQISDDNLHHVRGVMDEVFGAKNHVTLINFVKRTSATSEVLSQVNDYLLWFAKDRSRMKYRQLFFEKVFGGDFSEHYKMLESSDGGSIFSIGSDSSKANRLFDNGWRPLAYDSLMTAERGGNCEPFEYQGRVYDPGPRNNWKTSPDGLKRLAVQNRIAVSGNTLRYKRYIEDFPAYPLSSNWTDTTTFLQRTYYVQTNTKVVDRCLLMTTDPGDLVLDPTCGSGTTAYVAEQWGRRWITCDTSRVAVTLGKQRLMTAVFDYYRLAHEQEGVSSGFVYKTVPHVTLKSIANNEPPAQETLYDQPQIDKSKARVAGPFTVEAVPAPMVKSPEELASDDTRPPRPPMNPSPAPARPCGRTSGEPNCCAPASAPRAGR